MTFGVLLIIGIALVAQVIASKPESTGACDDFGCDAECLHDDWADEIRKMCCDGLEDCGARVGKWIAGLIMLIMSVIVLIIVGSCLFSPCCRKEDKQPQANAAPVVQAQAVEVSLQPNTTV